MNQHRSATATTFAAGFIALTGSFGASAAMAQAPRDVLIGVSTVRAPDSAPSTNSQANDLYAAASAAIRRGDLAYGQRQLELLVARYPDASAAQRARADLAAVYASVRVTDAKPDVRQMSHLGASDVSTQPAISAWRTAVKTAPGATVVAAQDRLRDAAGDMVFFSEGSAELGARSRKALAAQAAWLAKHRELPIVVEGHADESGTAAELQSLSQARAQAVRDRLVEEGVDAARIRLAAFAAERRAFSCPDRSCAGQNRRAVITVGGRESASLR